MTAWMTGTLGTLNTSLKVLPLRQTAPKATFRKSAGVGEQEWPDLRVVGLCSAGTPLKAE